MMSEKKGQRSKGAGSIRQRADGSWELKYDLPRSPEGKRRQKTETVRGTKRQAQEALTRLMHAVNTGTHVEPARMTVGDLLLKWLADCVAGNVSGKTYERYEGAIRVHLIPALGHILLKDLRPLHIQSHYTKMRQSGRRYDDAGLSPASIAYQHNILSAAMKQAVRWQLMPRNLAEAVGPPREKHEEMTALTEAETARLLEAAEGTRLYTPMLLAVFTGLRRGELLALRWSDVDLEASRLAVRQSLEQTKAAGLRLKEPKSSASRRVVALPSIAVEALVRHRGEQAQEKLLLGPGYTDRGLVFAQPDGEFVKPDTFSQAYKTLIARLDVPRVRLHDLRHTAATLLMKEGVNLRMVGDRLGHSDLATTMRYVHAMPGMDEEAARRVDEAMRKVMGEG